MSPSSTRPPGELSVTPVGWHRGPFRQKLGIPRQAGIHSAVSRIDLDTTRVGPSSVLGLEQVSHLWLTFGFSKHDSARAKDAVRPPRLGGTHKLGVFATRSPYRHNGLGLSLVELRSLRFPLLEIVGADLLDETPIYDIKPYLPWAEALPQAQCGWAVHAPAQFDLRFSGSANTQLQRMPNGAHVRATIEACLVVDPRPAYDRGDASREFRTRIDDVDVTFRVEGGQIVVLSLHPIRD